MIISINLNPVLIREVVVNNFSFEKDNYIEQHEVCFQDSPVNVGHIVKIMQGEIRALGFTGGTGGRHMKTYLNNDKIDTDLAWVEQEVQTRFELIDRENKKSTLLYAKEIELSPSDMKIIKQKLKSSLPDGTVFVFNGRIPNNMSEDTIKGLIECVTEKDKKFILALKTKYLIDLLQYKPYAVYIREEDLDKLDIGTSTAEETFQRVQELIIKHHIHYAVIDKGFDGIITITKNKICKVMYNYIMDIKDNPSVSDAVVGMLAVCSERNYELEKMSKLLCGAAVATMKASKPYLCERKDVDFLSRRVSLEELMSKSKGFTRK